MRLRLALILALVAFPVGVAAGVAVYDSRSAYYEGQARGRHMITATVTGEPISHGDVDSPLATMPAHWSAAGAGHSGAVVANRTAKIGDRIDIWVDDNGEAVKPATTTALDEAVMASFGIWLGTIIAAAAAIGVARFAIHRMRSPAG